MAQEEVAARIIRDYLVRTGCTMVRAPYIVAWNSLVTLYADILLSDGHRRYIVVEAVAKQDILTAVIEQPLPR